MIVESLSRLWQLRVKKKERLFTFDGLRWTDWTKERSRSRSRSLATDFPLLLLYSRTTPPRFFSFPFLFSHLHRTRVFHSRGNDQRSTHLLLPFDWTTAVEPCWMIRQREGCVYMYTPASHLALYACRMLSCVKTSTVFD